MSELREVNQQRLAAAEKELAEVNKELLGHHSVGEDERAGVASLIADQQQKEESSEKSDNRL